MNILIFDMDGVLLKPVGYHRALREAVRLAGVSVGRVEVFLTDEQIAHFEALGISSEWHSSALCMAVMVIEQYRGAKRQDNHARPSSLNLENLFMELAAQPMQDSALERGLAAIEILADENDVPSDLVSGLIAESESIQHSPTMNYFQELILGSEVFAKTYKKEPQFQAKSYLKLYDQRILSKPLVKKVNRWAAIPGHGAAIMTNRPSSGPAGFEGAPDAELGTALVGIAGLPLVGYGEIRWLAKQSRKDVGELSKPGWAHAMATILAASGWRIDESLTYAGQMPNAFQHEDLNHLQNSTITVFEDTPGGMVAVQEAGTLLNEIGLRVEVQKIGIAKDPAKQSALSAHGAAVYPDINQALADLDDF
jgi:phosphoglycolate phosphatase-like HAD superfamily hydrolase